MNCGGRIYNRDGVLRGLTDPECICGDEDEPCDL